MFYKLKLIFKETNLGVSLKKKRNQCIDKAPSTYNNICATFYI